MKDKTAVQEILDAFDNQDKTGRSAIDWLNTFRQEILSKERKQIKEAWSNGNGYGWSRITNNPDDGYRHYNNTYTTDLNKEGQNEAA